MAINKTKESEEKKAGLPNKTFYSIKEVADYLCCSESAIRAAFERGSIDLIQPLGEGGKFMMPRSELLRILTGKGQ